MGGGAPFPQVQQMDMPIVEVVPMAGPVPGYHTQGFDRPPALAPAYHHPPPPPPPLQPQPRQSIRRMLGK